MRCVFEGDGNGVLIVFSCTQRCCLYVRASLRCASLVPCASGLARQNRVDIVRAIDLYLDLDIDELVLRAVRKAVCLLGYLVEDIKAGAVVGLFDCRRKDIDRFRNGDRDGGVIDLDDFFALFILDAGTGVGGLGAAVVVVGNGKLDDELAAMRLIVLIEAAPFIGIVKTSNRNTLHTGSCIGGRRRLQIGSLSFFPRQRLVCFACAFGGIDLDSLCFGRNREVAGNVIDDGRGLIQLGGVSLDRAANCGEDVAQLTRACCSKVIGVVIVLFELCIVVARARHARCVRIVRGDKVHKAVRVGRCLCFFVIVQIVPGRSSLYIICICRKTLRIPNVCSLEDANRIDSRFMGLFRRICCLYSCLCYLMRIRIIILTIISAPDAIAPRRAIGENDHNTSALTFFGNGIFFKNTVCFLNAFVDISAAIGLQTVNRAFNCAQSGFHANQGIARTCTSLD